MKTDSEREKKHRKNSNNNKKNSVQSLLVPAR